MSALGYSRGIRSITSELFQVTPIQVVVSASQYIRIRPGIKVRYTKRIWVKFTGRYKRYTGSANTGRCVNVKNISNVTKIHSRCVLNNISKVVCA